MQWEDQSIKLVREFADMWARVNPKPNTAEYKVVMHMADGSATTVVFRVVVEHTPAQSEKDSATHPEPSVPHGVRFYPELEELNKWLARIGYRMIPIPPADALHEPQEDAESDDIGRVYLTHTMSEPPGIRSGYAHFGGIGASFETPMPGEVRGGASDRAFTDLREFLQGTGKRPMPEDVLRGLPDRVMMVPMVHVRLYRYEEPERDPVAESTNPLDVKTRPMPQKEENDAQATPTSERTPDPASNQHDSA